MHTLDMERCKNNIFKPKRSQNNLREFREGKNNCLRMEAVLSISSDYHVN